MLLIFSFGLVWQPRASPNSWRCSWEEFSHGRLREVGGHCERSNASLKSCKNYSQIRKVHPVEVDLQKWQWAHYWSRRIRGQKTSEVELQTSLFSGMQWNVCNNTLEVCRVADKKVTKEDHTRSIAFFRGICLWHFGLFAPFTMRKRIPLKTIWAKNEQPSGHKKSEEGAKQFPDWVRGLAHLKSMPLNRRYFKNFKRN